MRIERHFGWQNTLVLANDNLEVITTLDVGPRILSFRRIDGENILGVFEDQLGASNEAEFKLRGGHRLWLAPENARTYFPDNGEVDPEELSDNHVRLTAPPELQIQKSLELQLHDDSLSLTHRITALSELNSVSAWALTVFRRGGTAIVPQPEPLNHPGHADETNEAAYLPDRHLSLWSYTNMNDQRIDWGNPVTIKQQADAPPLKLGFLHREKVVHYDFDSERFTKSVAFDPGASYPDGNCNLEVYTDSNILELETLSPLTHLAKDEVIIHQETWTLS